MIKGFKRWHVSIVILCKKKTVNSVIYFLLCCNRLTTYIRTMHSLNKIQEPEPEFLHLTCWCFISLVRHYFLRQNHISGFVCCFILFCSSFMILLPTVSAWKLVCVKREILGISRIPNFTARPWTITYRDKYFWCSAN